MPIEIKCPKCKRAFRVPDKYGGKRIKCPKCQATIAVPAASESPAGKPGPRAPAPQKKTPGKRAAAVKPSPHMWYLQAEDGEQYGPVAKEELDGWIADGRIDAACQLLQEGWQQWKWAEDVYPQLAETPAEPAHKPAPAATDENPFAGIVQTSPSERKGVRSYHRGNPPKVPRPTIRLRVVRTLRVPAVP